LRKPLIIACIPAYNEEKMIIQNIDLKDKKQVELKENNI